jgi:hypothetical protein
MTVSAEEFVRRFLLHVLPKGFVRIRHFGSSAANVTDFLQVALSKIRGESTFGLLL